MILLSLTIVIIIIIIILHSTVLLLLLLLLVDSVVPLQIEVPKSEVITTEGADIELMCVFVGSPSPQITWYKDRQKLANNDSQVTVTLNNKCEAFLKLKSVTLLDAGKYGCEGGNLAGNVRGNITLFVKGEYYSLLSFNSVILAK